MQGRDVRDDQNGRSPAANAPGHLHLVHLVHLVHFEAWVLLAGAAPLGGVLSRA